MTKRPKPKDRVISVRVDTSVYGAALAKAASMGRSLSNIGRSFLVGVANGTIQVPAVSPIERRATKRMARRQKGIVYFVRDNKSGLTKIGCTTQTMERRLPALKIQQGVQDVDVLRVIESSDARSLERQYHARFSNRRVGGEWFELAVDEIARL